MSRRIGIRTISSLEGVEFKIPYQTVEGTTDISTDSDVLVDMDDMALTVAESGTYLIIFSASCGGPSGVSPLASFTILKNAEALCKSAVGGYAWLTSNPSMIIVKQLSAGDVVKVQWTGGGGGLFIYNRPATQYEHRTLTLIKLA